MVSLAGHSAANVRADEPGLASRMWMGFAVALLILGFGLVGLRLAGFQFISVRGHSMEPTFSPGALLIARSARRRRSSPETSSASRAWRESPT